MIKEILVFHHSHLDVGYTHSQPFVWELQQEYLTQVIAWLESTGDGVDARSTPRWTCEATDPVLRWIDRSPAPLVDRFVALCRSGRISLSLGASRHGARRSPRPAPADRRQDRSGKTDIASHPDRLSIRCQRRTLATR